MKTPEELAAEAKAKADAEAKAKTDAEAKAKADADAKAGSKPIEDKTQKKDAALVDDVARLEGALGELADFVGFKPAASDAAAPAPSDWWKDPFGFHSELFGQAQPAPGAAK